MIKTTRIYDTIHGFITITPLMKKFIDTEEFQRLRDLKQLGATSLVFPSANHTRFEHSIGVSHLAGLMMERIKVNGQSDVSDKDIELCRIAGLLHDIGHGPFSHLYDDFVKDGGILDHEERGCLIIRNMVKKYNIELLEDDIEEIIKMICPKENKYNWKYQIIANKINQLDVDKLDYIQRDCFYLGMKCGGEYSRIIKDCKVFMLDDDRSVLSWPIKLEYEIFQLFATRYRLHKQVYNHPNVKACEFIIIDMLKKISKTVDIREYGDSIIYCKYVDLERKQLFLRKHLKFIGEFTFIDEKIDECIKYIKENNIFYQKLEIGFGGKINPLKSVNYFKDNKLVKKQPLSFMIPDKYKETIIRIYSSNKEDIRHYKILCEMCG